MSRSRTRGRIRYPALSAGLALLAAGLIAGCTGDTGSETARGASRSPGRQVPPYWMEGVSVETVAQQLQVQIPASAGEAKAAYQKGFQDDGLLLTFVLPSDAVDGFLAGLKPQEPVAVRAVPFAGESTPVAPFAHLGLPEPDSLPGVRKAQVCAPCKGDLNALHVAVAQVDGERSRVYLKGID
ncbi:hypothetical protein [Streptomyces sp. NBC_00503]|uniref:hypothetical protein n=1 Tax=Streptomyces sp. NBC_00503 TaxID=2903659 RepID=UPI002E80B95B|nr:hypothetical protein [Streptomyces sp. NBC_00503]WUD85416.1 hypothetical protein OG490_35355 [Streptomyces sp. NBC_00503]